MSPAAATAVREAPSPARPRPSRVLRPADPWGVVVGTVWAAGMATPSLVPRDWVLQGVASGIAAAAGYGVGSGAAAVVRRLRGRRAEGAAPPAVLGLCAVALVATLIFSAAWQRRTAELNGMTGPSTAVWLCAGPLLVAVAAALVVGVRAAVRALRRAPVPVAAGGLAVVVVAAVLPWPGILERFDDRESAGVPAPTSALRSGSPASLVPWATLGREGRRFVAGGPSPERISRVRPVVAEPIRAYAGLGDADTEQGRVAVAMAELERTRAFDRPVLLVVTTTGTGWVNGAGVDAVEAMYGGDTATVATQYSALPSWLSFLLDRPSAAASGRMLWDAVRSRVDQMPPDRRPRLLAGGESLGSLGSESAFGSVAELRSAGVGAVWVGPTHANDLWRGLVARRDPGTPSTAPVTDGGRDVRFAADRAGLAGSGPGPAVVYLQHPSDPVVRWSPGLLPRRTDAFTGPPGADAHPGLTWLPVITFCQTTVDLVGSKSVPHGHGHNYDDLIPAAWVTVAAPPGWTEADTVRLLDRSPGPA